MGRLFRSLVTGLVLALPLIGLAPLEAEAQGRGRGGGADATAPSGVTLSVDLRAQIGDFYSSRPESGVEALPPGIRRRLERGKALPPGIAMKTAPPELHSRIELPAGYEIVEVGLDVLLVEVATNIVHDVLMDIVR
jgi:hypothetical protein